MFFSHKEKNTCRDILTVFVWYDRLLPIIFILCQNVSYYCYCVSKIKGRRILWWKGIVSWVVLVFWVLNWKFETNNKHLNTDKAFVLCFTLLFLLFTSLSVIVNYGITLEIRMFIFQIISIFNFHVAHANQPFILYPFHWNICPESQGLNPKSSSLLLSCAGRIVLDISAVWWL